MVQGIHCEQLPKDENPDNWKFVYLKILMPDGSWLTDDRSAGIDTIEIRRENKQWFEVHPYLYFTRHGNNQSCSAKIWVEERSWLHIPTGKTKIKRDIEVEFSEELGTEAGSWEGGCIGCSYEMLPGETPLQTLRRMEKERSFD